MNQQDQLLLSEMKLYLRSVCNFIDKISFKSFYWSTTAFGVLWLFAFFLSVGRLPDLDPASLTALVLATSLGGFFFTSILIIYFMLPSFFIQLIWLQSYPPQDKTLHKTYRQKQENIFFVSSFLMLVIAEFLFSALAVYLSNDDADLLHHWSIIGASMMATIVFFYYQHQKCKFTTDYINLFYPKNHLLTCVLLGLLWFVISVFFLAIFVKPLNFAAAQKESFLQNIQLSNIFLFIVAIFIFNHLVIKFETAFAKLVGTVSLGLALLAFYLALNGSGSLIKAPFRVLRLGDVEHAQLLISKNTCEYLSAQHANICTPNKTHSFGLIKNITILSNIGNEWVVSPKDQIEKLIFIQKSQILSWSVTKEKTTK